MSLRLPQCERDKNCRNARQNGDPRNSDQRHAEVRSAQEAVAMIVLREHTQLRAEAKPDRMKLVYAQTI
jgi:hypothetical protein